MGHGRGRVIGRFLLVLVSAGAGVDGPVGGLVGCAEHRRLRLALLVALSTFGCVPTAPHGAGGTHRCRRHPAADSRRWPTTPTPRSVRTVCTRVRGTGRGFGAQDGVATPVQWGKTPDRAPNPRPEGHDGRLSEEASPVSWAHSWAHTGDTPAPHSRTRGGVADVRQGCGRSPGARRQPSDASTTLGRVRNEASPTRRRAPTRASRNQINKPPQNLRLDTQHHRQPRPRDGWPHRVPIRGLMPCGGVGRNPVTERRVRRHGQGQRPASTAAQPAKAQARVIDGAPCATSASPRPGASPGT